MAIGDLPRIPADMNERIRELTQHIKDDEISTEKVIQTAAAVLGKTRIDQNGIRTVGDFGEIYFDSDDLNALIRAASIGIDLFYIINGCIFYVKTGEKTEKFTLKYLPLFIETDHIPEKEREELPIVEFIPDKDGNYPEKRIPVILEFLKKQFIDGVPVREPGFVIHNFQGFAGFFKDWTEFSLLLEIPTALLELTVKKKILKTGESAMQLIDNILRRCGV